MKDTTLTTVKILSDLYKDFKVLTVQDKMSLQCLTNRALYLYVHDNKFKQQIDENTNLAISGSIIK